MALAVRLAPAVQPLGLGAGLRCRAASPSSGEASRRTEAQSPRRSGAVLSQYKNSPRVAFSGSRAAPKCPPSPDPLSYNATQAEARLASSAKAVFGSSSTGRLEVPPRQSPRAKRRDAMTEVSSKLLEAMKAPGPGSYDTTRAPASPRGSFGRAPRMLDCGAPGMRGLESGRSASSSSPMGRRRSASPRLCASDTAPRLASPSSSSSSQRAPRGATFVLTSVGPGAYEVPTLFGKGPAFTATPRRACSPSLVPGPGAYMPQEAPGSPQASLRRALARPGLSSPGLSSRATLGGRPVAAGLAQFAAPQPSLQSVASSMPRREATICHPGYVGPRSPRATFGFAPRMQQVPQGPGHYAAVPVFGAQSPAFSMAGRPPPVRADSPGPGDYEQPRAVFS